MEKKLLENATKTRIDSIETVHKKLSYETAEVAG